MTIGSGYTGHTNRHAGGLTGDPCRSGALAVQWRSTSPRPMLRVVVNVDANHKMTGSLVLLFKEVVESQVRMSPTGPSSM